MNQRLAVLALCLATLPASAERADSLKATSIDFVDARFDDVAQTRTLTGKVVLTRGTLQITADKAVVKETPEGFSFMTLTAAPGRFVTFRQKRDGGPDLWFQGQAERIEYDDRAELVKLFSKALVKQTEHGQVTEQMESEFISYDSRTQVLAAHNDAGGANAPGKGLGTITYAPRRAIATAAPAAGETR